MSLITGMFDSTEMITTESGYAVGNKAVGAGFFARYLSSFFGSGVFRDGEDAFKVVPGVGMKVKVLPGSAFIKGYFCYDDSEKEFTFDSYGVYYIRLRLDEEEGEITLSAVESASVPGGEPVREDGIYDLLLARVFIPAGSQVITEDFLTDLREDGEYCGFVKGTAETLGSVAHADSASALDHLDTEVLPEGEGAVSGSAIYSALLSKQDGLFVGSYTGNGSDQSVTIGFDTRAVLLKSNDPDADCDLVLTFDEPVCEDGEIIAKASAGRLFVHGSRTNATGKAYSVIAVG